MRFKEYLSESMFGVDPDENMKKFDKSLVKQGFMLAKKEKNGVHEWWMDQRNEKTDPIKNYRHYVRLYPDGKGEHTIMEWEPSTGKYTHFLKKTKVEFK